MPILQSGAIIPLQKKMAQQGKLKEKAQMVKNNVENTMENGFLHFFHVLIW